MVRAKGRVTVQPVRGGTVYVTAGTRRARHLWCTAGPGKRKQWCKWCGATTVQAVGQPCVELSDKERNQRIADTVKAQRSAWPVSAAFEELARHEAKKEQT